MGKTMLTDEMLEEILEERKTMTLEQLAEKWTQRLQLYRNGKITM